MARRIAANGKSTMAGRGKTGAVVKCAESPRMRRLANIPTVQRRQAAVELLLKRAK